MDSLKGSCYTLEMYAEHGFKSMKLRRYQRTSQA